MSAFIAAVTRHPRVVLAISVAVFAGHVVGRWYAPGYGAIEDTLILLPTIVVVVSIILLIAASTVERPPNFVVRSQERSFSPPASLSVVASALASTAVASLVAGSLVQSIRSHNVDLLFGILAGICVSLTALGVIGAWRDRGLQLRPEGLYWWVPTGSMRVPWAALAPGHPPRPELRARTLTLTYARPELLRRRGLVPKMGLLRIDTVHPWFIADAIRHYGTYPEYRAAIGTEAEYRRLLYALHHGPAGPPTPSATFSKP